MGRKLRNPLTPEYFEKKLAVMIDAGGRICARCKTFKQPHEYDVKARHSWCKPCLYDDHVQRKYGITAARVAELLAEQGGVCAICAVSALDVRMCVDHDHRTGTIRGILCWECNVGIGKFVDSSSRLRRAAAYLEEER